MATAGFIDKLKKVIASGIATPPPPIPATFAIHIKDANTNVPIHSLVSNGHNGLCLHTFYVEFVSFTVISVHIK